MRKEILWFSFSFYLWQFLYFFFFFLRQLLDYSGEEWFLWELVPHGPHGRNPSKYIINPFIIWQTQDEFKLLIERTIKWISTTMSLYIMNGNLLLENLEKPLENNDSANLWGMKMCNGIYLWNRYTYFFPLSKLQSSDGYENFPTSRIFNFLLANEECRGIEFHDKHFNHIIPSCM